MSKTVNKVPNIKINCNTLAKSVTSIYDLVEKGKWNYYYDDDLDQLYITPITGITKDFSLISVDQEFSVYIDDKSNVGGVMISYFRSNLSNHDNLFKQYKQIFTKKIDGGKTIPENKKTEIKDLTLSKIFELEKSVLNNSCLA